MTVINNDNDNENKKVNTLPVIIYPVPSLFGQYNISENLQLNAAAKFSFNVRFTRLNNMTMGLMDT